jgi:hypothetical protein
VALIIYGMNQEEDESLVGVMARKSLRAALSAVGALDPNFWSATARSLAFVQDLAKALTTLVLLEEYKTGEKEGTLKGDDQLLRLITPAPARQIGRDLEQRNTNNNNEQGGLGTGFQLGFDLDSPAISGGAGFQVDFDL